MSADHTLLILRHAQAGGLPGNGPDEQRPLTGEGRVAATAAGRWLRAGGLIPGRVLCSTACRARQTWQLVCAELPAGAGAEVSFDRGMYEAGAEGLLALAQECPEETGVLLIVGHNPAAHQLATGLTGRGDLSFPAGALAVVQIAGSWRGAGPGTAGLLKFWRPPGPG